MADRWRNPFPSPVLRYVCGEAFARACETYWSLAASLEALRVRAGARHACARLRRERDEAREQLSQLERRELAALEWLALRGYPCGRGADGRVSARYSEDGEPMWFDSWAECARDAGWEG